jgi:hypothetical protein
VVLQAPYRAFDQLSGGVSVCQDNMSVNRRKSDDKGKTYLKMCQLPSAPAPSRCVSVHHELQQIQMQRFAHPPAEAAEYRADPYIVIGL